MTMRIGMTMTIMMSLRVSRFNDQINTWEKWLASYYLKKAFAGLRVAKDWVHSRANYILMSTSHWIANIFINIVGGMRYRVHLSSKMSSDGKRRCQALGPTPSHIVGGWCDLSTLYTLATHLMKTVSSCLAANKAQNVLGPSTLKLWPVITDAVWCANIHFAMPSVWTKLGGEGKINVERGERDEDYLGWGGSWWRHCWWEVGGEITAGSAKTYCPPSV